MKNNLIDQASAENIIERAGRLTSNSKPLWGQMNVTEMLLHCNLCNQQILDGDIEKAKTGLKQKLIRLLALYLVRQFPKHMKSAERNITKNKIAVNAFDEDLYRFINIAKQFPNGTRSKGLAHPAFGILDDKEWGIAAWKHTDHHLRQFGV